MARLLMNALSSVAMVTVRNTWLPQPLFCIINLLSDLTHHSNNLLTQLIYGLIFYRRIFSFLRYF